MKKKLLSTVLAALLSLSLVNCGGDTSSNSATSLSGTSSVSGVKLSVEDIKSQGNSIKVAMVQSKVSEAQLAPSRVSRSVQKVKTDTIADIFVSMVTMQDFKAGLGRNYLTNEGIDTSSLSDTEINEIILESLGSATAQKSPSRLQRASLLDTIKSGLVDSLDSSLGQTVMSTSFSAVLESTELTKEMIELARGSQTITDIMVDALKDDFELTKKMEPMLTDDVEFGELFTLLAIERPSVGVLSFEMITPSLYDALTFAMIMNKTTTVNLAKMMNLYALDYLVLPGNGVQGTYGMTDTFAKLFFNKNLDKTNQRFFYAMFKHPESTTEFVKAFKKVKSEDSSVSTSFLDLVFLGQDLDGVEDINTSYQNIYAIAGGMYKGIDEYEFNAYAGSFLGFATLVQVDRYLPYGKRFYNAGMQYGIENGYNTAEFTSLVIDYMFKPEDNATVQQSPARIQRSFIRPDSNATVYEDLVWYYEQIGLKYDDLTTYLGDFNTSVITDPIGNYVEAEAREYIQTQARDFLQDQNFTMPDLRDINSSYISGQFYLVVDNVMMNPGESLYTFSNYSYVQEYIYGNGEAIAQFAYIPYWMTQKDWLKVPATYDGYQFKVVGSVIEFYLVSENGNLDEVKNIVGFDTITLLEENIVTDSGVLYVYKVQSYNLAEIDFAALQDSIKGIFL